MPHRAIVRAFFSVSLLLLLLLLTLCLLAAPATAGTLSVPTISGSSWRCDFLSIIGRSKEGLGFPLFSALFFRMIGDGADFLRMNLCVFFPSPPPPGAAVAAAASASAFFTFDMTASLSSAFFCCRRSTSIRSSSSVLLPPLPNFSQSLPMTATASLVTGGLGS